jgi:hypothetical protein
VSSKYSSTSMTRRAIFALFEGACATDMNLSPQRFYGDEDCAIPVASQQ